MSWIQLEAGTHTHAHTKAANGSENQIVMVSKLDPVFAII